MILTDIPRTVFDFTVYGEAIRQRKLRTFGYFALLLLATSVAISGALTFRLNRWIEREVMPEIDRLPTIIIEDGVASSNVPQPWIKKFPDDKSGRVMVLILDTTGVITDFAPNEGGFLMTRTDLLIRDPQKDTTQSIPLSQVPNVRLDPKELAQRYTARAMWTFFAIVALALLVWSTLAKLVHSLILLLVALIVVGKRQHKLSFGKLWTLSLYALTPAILLDTAQATFGLHIPVFLAMYALVAIVYVVLAVRQLPDVE